MKEKESVQVQMRKGETVDLDPNAVVKRRIERLWGYIYDNAIDVVSGTAEPNITLNLEYIEVRSDLALIQGDPKEATRLQDQADYLRARG